MKRIAFLCALACGAALAGEPVRPIDREAARALADTKSHAAPTIVALWSSDCAHCKSNLDLFARMARADARLRVITVAVEPPSIDLAAPLDRLGVPGRRLAYGPDAPEAIAYALDPGWRGELPRTLFFDGRGKRTAVSGVVDQAQVRNVLGL